MKIKTEMKGTSGRRMRRADAKRFSRKARRTVDKLTARGA